MFQSKIELCSVTSFLILLGNLYGVCAKKMYHCFWIYKVWLNDFSFRTKQTEEEVIRLEKIKKELQVIDGQFSQDVSVLRKKIDQACLSYADAEWVLFLQYYFFHLETFFFWILNKINIIYFTHKGHVEFVYNIIYLFTYN